MARKSLVWLCDQSMGPRLFEKFGEAVDFGFGGFAAQRREAVIAAALVVLIFAGALVFAEFDDESVFEEAFDEAVECSGAEAKFTGRAGGDVLHNAVAVLVAIGEGDEDVEGLGRQSGHGKSISRLCIVSRDAEICRES